MTTIAQNNRERERERESNVNKFKRSSKLVKAGKFRRESLIKGGEL